MKLQFLGHSAFLIEATGFKAVIDPFLSGNPSSTLKPSQLNDLTHIFVTHGHGDHIGDTIELARENKALVISNAEIANYLSEHGLRTHGMHIGGRYTFDFGVVKMTPALHGSSIPTSKGPRDGGNPCGIVLTLDGKKIYHAGDTGLTMDMKLLEEEKIDVALLPIGGNYTMDIHDALRAVEFIKPRITVPMHYNTFPLIKADPELFKAKNSWSETIILKIGEKLEI